MGNGVIAPYLEYSRISGGKVYAQPPFSLLNNHVVFRDSPTPTAKWTFPRVIDIRNEVYYGVDEAGGEGEERVVVSCGCCCCCCCWVHTYIYTFLGWHCLAWGMFWHFFLKQPVSASLELHLARITVSCVCIYLYVWVGEMIHLPLWGWRVGRKVQTSDMEDNINCM